jgi:CheY-like chemotaxis protein
MALRELGVVTESLSTAGSALDEVARKNPYLIFLDVSLDGSDAIDVIRGLGKLGYAGHVQLISGRNEALLNDINRIGQQHSLRMLPALAKPFDVTAVRNVIRHLSVNDEETHKESVGLKEALRQNWIEFWYQPKYVSSSPLI